MVFTQYALFDVLREIAFGAITSVYQNVGPSFSVNPRIIAFNNSTDVDLYISTDAVDNMLRIAANSFKLYDVEANKSATGDNLFPMSTSIFVKETSDGPPTKGHFWVEAQYSISA